MFFILYWKSTGEIKTYARFTDDTMQQSINRQLAADPDLAFADVTDQKAKCIKMQINKVKYDGSKIIDRDMSEKFPSEIEKEKSLKIMDKMRDIAIKELEKEGEL